MNLVGRRKSAMSTENRQFNFHSPSYIKSPPHPFIRDTPSKDSTKLKSTNDDEIFSPVPTENDECFKSPPFMSPSIYSRRGDPSMSPFNDIYDGMIQSNPIKTTLFLLSIYLFFFILQIIRERHQ